MFVPNFAERVLADHETVYLAWLYRNERLHVIAFEEADIAEYKRALSRPGRMKAGFELYRTLELDIRDNAQLSRTPLSIPVLAIGTQCGLCRS